MQIRTALATGASSIRTVVRSRTFQTLVTNMSIMACGLFTSIVIGRSLGPEGRGEIAAILLWPALLVVFGSTGFIPAVLYQASGNRDRPGDVAGTAGLFSVAQSTVTVLVGYLTMPWLLASQSTATVSLSRLYLLVVPLAIPMNYGWSLLQAQSRIGAYNLVRLVTPVGYLLGTVALAVAGLLSPARVVVLQLCLTLGTVTLTLWLFVAGTMRLEGIAWSRSTLRRLYQYGRQVQLGDFSHRANLQLDQVLMSAWLAPAQLGLYTAAVGASALAQLLGTASKPVLLSKVTNASNQVAALSAIHDTWRRFLRVGGLALPVFAVLIPVLMPVVYGPEFKAASPVALVLLCGAFMLGGKDILGAAAQGLGIPSLTTRAELTGVAVTAVLIAPAILTFGIMGAALTSSISYCLQVGVLSHGLRHLGFSPFRRVEPRVVST